MFVICRKYVDDSNTGSWYFTYFRFVVTNSGLFDKPIRAGMCVIGNNVLGTEHYKRG